MLRTTVGTAPRLTACLLLQLAAASAQAGAVGWLFAEDGAVLSASGTVRIQRAANPSVAAPFEVESCDLIELTRPQDRVLLKLLNGDRVWLHGKAARFKVPCAELSFSERFRRAVMAFAPPPRRAGEALDMAATRTADDLNVLGLGNFAPQLAAGPRALFVAWSGGLPPFAARLERVGDARPVAESRLIRGRAVDLPRVDLAPGRYVLVVSDAAGTEVRDADVQVVEVRAVPAAPGELAGGDWDPVEKGLLRALFLESFGTGEWRLEALQAVAALPRGDARVKAWLSRSGVR
jgi:hypothetical protein